MIADKVRYAMYREKLVVIHRQRDPETCVTRAQAARDGGLTIHEITWNTPRAASAIRKITQLKLGIVGSGTILTPNDARQAVDAGATFLVSPVYSKQIHAWARRRRILYISGASTPQEIYAAWEAGVRPVKIFPAPDVGGPGFLRRLRGPLNFIETMPTGNLGLDDIRPYLDAGANVVGLGGTFTDAGEGEVDGLARRAEQAIELAGANVPARVRG